MAQSSVYLPISIRMTLDRKLVSRTSLSLKDDIYVRTQGYKLHIVAVIESFCATERKVALTWDHLVITLNSGVRSAPIQERSSLDLIITMSDPAKHLEI